MSMIELEDVTKTYGTKLAVDRLTLHIERGEVFAFLGPNGAGKTTTIKLLCGLLFPTKGKVRIGGFDLENEGDKARQLISYVPDQPYLYEKLTGREFLQFIADMYGLAREHGRRRIGEMIDLFGLAGLRGRFDRALFARHAAANSIRRGAASRARSPDRGRADRRP